MKLHFTCFKTYPVSFHISFLKGKENLCTWSFFFLNSIPLEHFSIKFIWHPNQVSPTHWRRGSIFVLRVQTALDRTHQANFAGKACNANTNEIPPMADLHTLKWLVWPKQLGHTYLKDTSSSIKYGKYIYYEIMFDVLCNKTHSEKREN